MFIEDFCSLFTSQAPYDEDWFYVRCASMARHMYIRYGVALFIVSPRFIYFHHSGLQSASPPSGRSTASARATAVLLLTGAREPVVLPGRLSRPWRDWSWWRRIPMVAEGWPARGEETWTELLLSWRPRPGPRLLCRHHLSFPKCWINEGPRVRHSDSIVIYLNYQGNYIDNTTYFM